MMSLCFDITVPMKFGDLALLVNVKLFRVIEALHGSN